MPRIRIHAVVPLLAIVAIAVCLTTCFEIGVVPTASMQGTVLIGDHLLILKLFDGAFVAGTSLRLPRLGKVERGQVVSFHAPGEKGVLFLKRVVATSGDSVEMRDGVLYVNDVPEAEPYASPCKYRAEVARLIVPRDDIYVMGDNRDNSEDSRTFGPVPVESIVGRPLFVIWSLRTGSTDWFDEEGQPTNTIYWTALRHLVASTRWSRTGARI